MIYKLKNYENRLKVIKKLADAKSAKIAFLDYRNGKYYQDGKEIDISTIRANVIIVDDIPCDENLEVSSAPPESLKGSE